MHACYSLFFTAFIYHSVIESFVGWLFGIFIVGVTYETDIVSEGLYESFRVAYNTLLCFSS